MMLLATVFVACSDDDDDDNNDSKNSWNITMKVQSEDDNGSVSFQFIRDGIKGIIDWGDGNSTSIEDYPYSYSHIYKSGIYSVTVKLNDTCAFNCSRSNITSLVISDNNGLTSLYCDETNLTSLDVRNCKILTDLNCRYNEKLSSLDASNCTSLENIDCKISSLTSLNINGCNKLERLYCGDNNLSTLDASNCVNLLSLDCYSNKLTSINIDNCNSLSLLGCWDNKFDDDTMNYIYNALPDKTGIAGGYVRIHSTDAKGDITITKNKNWHVSINDTWGNK